ncbi:MAG: DUF5317 domain-containing protein [Firmicutes bacterium]|nr:DUF5317 domain-containing protein [Bacillota bacterium]MCL5040684.1 DUF5317 domain-containing protein [Bacillota bacterium]
MLSSAIIVSIIVGSLRGGRLGTLANLEFAHLGLVFLAFFLEVLLGFGLRWGLGDPLAAILHVSLYLLLLYALWNNRRLPGVFYLLTGVLLNCLVIAANGGRMPVSGPALLRLGLVQHHDLLVQNLSLTHQLMGPYTRLWWLGDYWLMPPPFPRPAAFSPGDALMVIGVFLLIQAAMLGRLPAATSKPRPR